MGTMSKVIAAILLAMGVIVLSVAMERAFGLWKGGRANQRFLRQAGPLLGSYQFEKMIQLASEESWAPLARLLHPTLSRYVKAREKARASNEATNPHSQPAPQSFAAAKKRLEETRTLGPAELARREAQRQGEVVSARLRRGMAWIASIGSIAPFVGLLGTVVGIITAFQGIAATGSGGLGSVSAGIAEALVETALGLMVAIPAVLLYNALTSQIGHMEATVQKNVGELLDELEVHEAEPRALHALGDSTAADFIPTGDNHVHSIRQAGVVAKAFTASA